MSDLTSALASIKLSLILLSLHGFLLHSLTNDQKEIIHYLILTLMKNLDYLDHGLEDTLIFCIAVGMAWRPSHSESTFWEQYLSIVLGKTKDEIGIREMGERYIRSLAGTDIQVFLQHECYLVQVWSSGKKVFESNGEYTGHPELYRMENIFRECGLKWWTWPDGSLKITEQKKMHWGPWLIAAVAVICVVFGIYIGKSGIV